MVTPIAVMVDFFSGWSFPRHLYSENVYRVWGNLPYEAGDYLTDGVLDMLYPGYQSSSYFHNESGFIMPTPYGDSADCILSDAEEWLLSRYPVLIVAGELESGLEVRDKLHAYVKNGGRLTITAGNLAKLPNGLAGIKVAGSGVRFESGETVQFETRKLVKTSPSSYVLWSCRIQHAFWQNVAIRLPLVSYAFAVKSRVNTRWKFATTPRVSGHLRLYRIADKSNQSANCRLINRRRRQSAICRRDLKMRILASAATILLLAMMSESSMCV